MASPCLCWPSCSWKIFRSSATAAITMPATEGLQFTSSRAACISAFEIDALYSASCAGLASQLLNSSACEAATRSPQVWLPPGTFTPLNCPAL